MLDPVLLVVRRTVQRAGGHEITPQSRSLRPHAVPEHDVLAHREAEEQLELLERARQAHPGALRRRGPRDALSVEEDVANLGAQQTGQDPEERGLSRAVRTDEADDRRRRHRHAQFAERDEPAEADGDVAGLDHRDLAGDAPGRARLRGRRGHVPLTSAVGSFADVTAGRVRAGSTGEGVPPLPVGGLTTFPERACVMR